MQWSNGIMCVIKDVSIQGTNYSIVRVATITIVKTTLPIIFSQKDL
jgi:hypothetical protein